MHETHTKKYMLFRGNNTIRVTTTIQAMATYPKL